MCVAFEVREGIQTEKATFSIAQGKEKVAIAELNRG
jgi:hypothetical protein